MPRRHFSTGNSEIDDILSEFQLELDTNSYAGLSKDKGERLIEWIAAMVDKRIKFVAHDGYGPG